MGKNQILAGKYRLVRQLGKGGMGSVWYAEHLTLQAPVAVKLMDPFIAKSDDALLRFLREAKAAAALRSPHVVQIFDHGVDDGIPFIVMEVLEGESLADRLAARGRLSPAETARILTHVARALSRAHEAGIVHRDLKPENIFLIRNDEEEFAKVLDFGIAKSMPSSLALSVSLDTRPNVLLGTPQYMSPEQADGKDSLDHRTDIWAMGVIAFECLLGTRPFEHKAVVGLILAICVHPLPVPSQVGPVPPGFDEWFARVCARDPKQRPTSAKAAAAELRRICNVPSVASIDADAASSSALASASIEPAASASIEPAASESSQRNAVNSVMGISTTQRRRAARRSSTLRWGAVFIATLSTTVAGATWIRSWRGSAALAPASAPTLIAPSPADSVEPPRLSTGPEVAPPLSEEPAANPPSTTVSRVPSATQADAGSVRRAPGKIGPRSAPLRAPAASAKPAMPKVNFGF